MPSDQERPAKRSRSHHPAHAAGPREPWERRPDESPEAFEGFFAYRDSGPHPALEKAAKRVGRSRDLMARWSRRHDWRERAYA